MNTTSRPLPPIFVSHGSPMIALQPGAAGAFLARLGPALEAAFARPRAIVAVSAHTLARVHAVLGAPRHETVHDFGGFPEALYRVRYDAPGDPALAQRIGERLAAAGLDAPVLPQGGLDHGIWTALMYAWPGADVPVVPVAMRPMDPPAAQFAFGQALASLADEGVLVLGTGSITHNLRRVAQTMQFHDAPPALPEIAESAAFRAWMAGRSAARDWDALFDYRARAPHAVDMHPTDEHLLPWYVAAGAGGRDHAPLRLHDSVTHGSLGMDVYAFGPRAAALAAALAPASG